MLIAFSRYFTLQLLSNYPPFNESMRVLGALYLRFISTSCVPTFIVASVYIATDTIWEYPPASLYIFPDIQMRD